MTTKVNILNTPDREGSPLLSIVRLDANETPVIPFTPEGEVVEVHYCEDPEVSSYVICNGPECLLCRVGIKHDRRVALPVYLPIGDMIGVLSMPQSYRPFALYPQIQQILRTPKPVVVFIRREGMRYFVSTSELKADMETGETHIAQFKKDSEAGHIQLAAVYPQLENAQLAELPNVARRLRLKGLDPHAIDNGT